MARRGAGLNARRRPASSRRGGARSRPRDRRAFSRGGERSASWTC